jgi:N-acetylneuraminic acid mutarotase
MRVFKFSTYNRMMVRFTLFSSQSGGVMKKAVLFLILLLAAAPPVPAESLYDSLPQPVTNNAVALLRNHRQILLFSLMGAGPTKSWEGVTNASYVLDVDVGKWNPIRPVPGTSGRIAAVAATARDHVFLFGGYVVDSHGRGMVVPDVNAYQLAGDRWFRSSDLQVAVGDAVAGVYEGRYIYIIGGRSNSGPVPNVQVYDSEKDKWSQATPMPGTPVFGHSGGLIGDTIVYVDGAARNPSGSAPRYVPSDECWLGKIDHHDRTKIHWSKLPTHPGSARFRIAGGGSDIEGRIYFSGGSAVPYDLSGIGYDGKPAEPSPVTFAFNVKTGKWETMNDNTPDPTMDHRGLLVSPDGLVVIGGMEKGQKVSARVAILPEEQPKQKR